MWKIFVLVSVFSLVACSNDATNEPEANATLTPAGQSAPTSDENQPNPNNDPFRGLNPDEPLLLSGGSCDNNSCNECTVQNCDCATISNKIQAKQQELMGIQQDMMSFSMIISVAERDKQELQAANDKLLGHTNNYGLKIVGFMGKAGIEAGTTAYGYRQMACSVSSTIGFQACKAGAATTWEATRYWFAYEGGKEAMKEFAISQGIAFASASCDGAIQGEVQSPTIIDYIPVAGTIKDAYNWSQTCFSASDIIEQNGDQMRNDSRIINAAKAKIDQLKAKADAISAEIQQLQTSYNSCMNSVYSCQMKRQMQCMQPPSTPTPPPPTMPIPPMPTP